MYIRATLPHRSCIITGGCDAASRPAIVSLAHTDRALGVEKIGPPPRRLRWTWRISRFAHRNNSAHSCPRGKARSFAQSAGGHLRDRIGSLRRARFLRSPAARDVGVPIWVSRRAFFPADFGPEGWPGLFYKSRWKISLCEISPEIERGGDKRAENDRARYPRWQLRQSSWQEGPGWLFFCPSACSLFSWSC